MLQQPRLCGLSARAKSRVALRSMLVQLSELVFLLHWTKQLGRYDTKPEEELETARRKVTIKPGCDGTWVVREDLLSLHSQEEEPVTSIARERKNKARAG